MKKILSVVLTCLFVCMASCVAFAGDDEGVATPQKRRFLGNEKVVQLFMDSNQGFAMMEQKAFDNFAKQLQEVLPSGYRLEASNEFVGKVDLYREDKLQSLIAKSGDNAVFAAQNQAALAMAGQSLAVRIPLTREDWNSICRDNKVDYIMYIQIDKGMEKVKTSHIPYAALFGGGSSTQVEMIITTRLFNVAKGDYTYTNKQQVTGKVHGQFAPDTAAKRALPKVIPNLHLSAANF